jgi:intein/homing endonuclease
MDRNEQLQEFAKCLADPVYAIETYLETFDQTQSGYVPFHLFPKQKELVHSIFENRFTIVTKPRQAGITTTTAACMAVKVSFYGDEDIPDKILILANRQEIAQEFLKKIKEFLEQVPRWVWGIEYVEDQKKSIFLTDSKKHIILPTKCEIKALATSKDALRGFTPTILVMDEAAYIDNGAEVYGAALPSLGCLDEKTLIITEDGLKPLGKLIKDKETQGFHDLDKPFKVVNRYGELENVTKTFTSSFDKTFTIRTKRGLELTGSWKHPVLIDKSNKDEWVRMYELNVGDKVMFNYNQNKFGNDNKLDFSYNGRKGSKVLNLPDDLTDHLDLCYLFGLFISEGNYNNGGIHITNGDEDIRNFLTNDLKKYGIIFKEYRKYKFQFISQEFRTFLKYLGLEQLTAPFKKFPDRFLTLSKPLISAILQGMFDGDGCSTNKEIKYSSTSKELINTLQVLLLNYGINSNVRESCSKPSKNSVCSNKDKVTCIYDLFIYSSDAIKFYNEIGFRLKRKQKNLSSLKNVSGSPKRSFEYDKDKIRKITKDNNFKSRSYRYLERFLLTDNKNISFYSANRLLSNCTVVTDEVVELENHLEKLNHYFEDEIVDIEEFYGNTYDLHLPETNSFISNGFISHNTGGKAVLISCVTKDTMVFTDKGIKEISDFLPNENLGPEQINTYNVLGKDKIRSGNIIHKNGFVDTLKIKTVHANIEGSLNHKLWVYDSITKKYGWKKLEDITLDDYLSIQYGLNIWGNNDDTSDFIPESETNNRIKNIFNPKKITKEMSYFLGLYLSEGCSTKKIDGNGKHVGTSTTITCGDFVGKYIEDIGLKYSSHDNLHYTISSKDLSKYLEYLGFNLNLKAKEKYIPHRLLNLSKENIKYLLRGMFDGDGYSRKDRGTIGISLSSKKMVNQIRMLLNNFGILTDYQERITPPTKKVKVSSQCYGISLSGIDSLKFYDEIGFNFERKQKNKLILDTKKINRSSPYDVIPNGKEYLKKLVTEIKKINPKKLSGLRLSVEKDNISRDLLLKVLSISNELNIDTSFVDGIVSNNLKWVKVRTIEKSKNWTYDFSLPNNEEDFWSHSVVYNGLLGHQTPNGYDDLYYKIYDGAVNKRNKYNVVEMRWYQDLRYNKNLRWYKGDHIINEELFTLESYREKIENGYKPTSDWYESMCAEYNGDTRKIAQELDVSFLGSGGNVIDEEYVENHNKYNVRTPIRTEGFDNGVWIWEEPQLNHRYILGCLPPNEKVLTDTGLKDIQDIQLTDRLVSENGDYVNIINKQIYPVIDENIYEIKVDNTFRTTTFTKEHPLLISKPILERNYKKTHDTYRFNERYWDFDFNYVRTEDVEIGDWIKVPNIYKKEDETIMNDKWKISTDIRYDFEFDSPLKNEDFWWFMGMWLGDGWLGKNNYSYKISICFGKKDYKYVEKTEKIIKTLFKRSPSFTEEESTYELTFNSKFLYHFILENFGQYSYGKKISEWVKFIPQRYKKELIRGYFDSDGCWVITKKRGKINSKISFVSINLELLESIQDIIFSLGVISSLNKLRDSKLVNIKGKECIQKEVFNISLANNDSIELIKLIYKEDDSKLNKFNVNDFYNINNRIIKSCHFDKNKDFIYFRVKDIKKNTFTGNVYNFECDTHTFMCHHITTHNCDVSRGDSEDFSTIQIIDFETREQVLEYQGKIPPDVLAEIVYNYGEKYKAYVVVDITGGMGVTTVLKLVEMEYKNLHFDDPKSKILSTRKDLGKYRKYDNKVPGFNVGANRLNMIAEFERSIRQNEVIIRSSRLISEMKTFVYRNGRPDHMDGYHDDLLMGVAMCLWVLQTSFKNLEKVNDQTKAILNSWVSTSTVNNNVNTSSTINPNQPPPPPNLPNSDFMWLLGGMK